jgi:hypothetical protein
MSRGTLRWEDEDGPTVGRSPEVPRPVHASTPLETGEIGGEGKRRDGSDYEVRDMQLDDSKRGFIDVTNWQIQHLTELLESERRMVKVLSSVSRVEWPGSRGGEIKEPDGSREREGGVDFRDMPVLEDMRAGSRDGPGKPTAAEMYSHHCKFDDVLAPQVLDESSGKVLEPKKPVHNDLEWYDELIKARESRDQKEGGKEEKTGRKNERYLPRMKPSSYDGQSPYEDYQVQFNMLAELNGWPEDVKALYLAGCLSGSARSVLNDMDPQARYDYAKLDEALRERFGTDDQSELFKAKLRNRIKTKEETLQELAHDVRRLVRLAYPKAPVRTHDDLTKDQFIEALGDGEIRWSVFQARPKNITEALKVAMELEAFKESEKCRMRRNIRGVKAEEMELQGGRRQMGEAELDGGQTKLPLDLRQMVAQINQMHQLGQGNRGSLAPSAGGPGVMGERDGGKGDGLGLGPPTTGNPRNGSDFSERGYGSQRVPFDVSRIKCFRCDKMGHFARECPELARREVGKPKVENGLNA